MRNLLTMIIQALRKTSANGFSCMTKRETHKNSQLIDWHRADIIAARRKRSWCLRRLATHRSYASPNTLTTALARRWPKGERIIAAAIGVDPSVIWPGRYTDKNNTQVRKGHREAA